MPETKIAEQQRVEIRRVIRASRARVYEAWTKPEILAHWYGPGAMRLEKATMDVRTGGTYCLQLLGTADGNPEFKDRRVTVEGVYLEVVPNELLRYSWRPDWNPGEDSEVTLRFQDLEGGTEVMLTHERFASMESRNGHAQGWTSILNKLEAFLQQ